VAVIQQVDTVPDIRYQIKIYIFRGRHTRADTQQSIYNGKNNGRYIIQEIQLEIYYSRYTVAHTKCWIHRGTYTAVDV